MSRRIINDPYSKFTNKDKDYVSAKINFDKSISIDFFSIVLSGDVSKLSQFITNKGDVINALNEDGINALHIVLNTDLSELNKLNVIKYLLSKKIYTENKNKMGETPLHIASKNNYKSIIVELVKNGADIQASDSLGKTPIHYLARGLVVECEKTYIEDIIDDPKPKHDKKVISQMAKQIKEFYNGELLNNWANSLESIQNNGNAGANYNNRLIDFFGHVKSAAKKLIKSNDILNKDSLQIANEIKKIAVDVTLSDEEKKLQTEKIRKDYYNKVYKVIQNFDYKFDQNIDLTPTFHVDSDGLILAKNDGSYSNDPFGLYGIQNNTSFYKVNGEATLNQEINTKIEETKNDMNNIQNSMLEDIDNLHNEIGNGVIETCENLASFIHTIEFYEQIWRLNEFILANSREVHGINVYRIDRPPINAPRTFTSKKHDFRINTNEINTPDFQSKYFLRYGINNLDYRNQNIHTANNQFNENALTNNLSRNNLTSQNLIANGNEIVIDLSNFNWNFSTWGGAALDRVTLAIHNKTNLTTTYITRDFVYNDGAPVRKQTNIKIVKLKQNNPIFNFVAGGPAQNHLNVGDVNQVLPISFAALGGSRLQKLIRLRIRKPKQSSSINTINLTLDYINYNGQNQSLQLGEGQFEIGFKSSNAVGNILEINSDAVVAAAGGVAAAAAADLYPSFKISDFESSDITYQNFFDVHEGGGNAQFLFLPIIALINQIKSNYFIVNIKNNISKLSYPDNDWDVNINQFYNRLHKWYIRYYETLSMYTEEHISKSIAKVRRAIDLIAFKNNLQNPLYNNMYQNLINYNFNLQESIDSEISIVRRIMLTIIKRANNFIDTVDTTFGYYNIFQYFNERNKRFALQHDMSINEDSRDKIRNLNNKHFSDNDNNLMPAGDSRQYFTKYNNGITNIVIKRNENDFPMQPIGINFIDNAGGQSFTDVAYDPRILKGYFYLARYRMIEELVLDIHFQSETANDPKKDIYDMVKKYVTDNLGQVNPLMERPLILSIIGDLIDNHLISNVKKALYDAVTELVNQQISPNIGTQPIPTNAIPFIVQATNPVTGPGDVEINYSAVDFDVEFGLNLGKQDELVRKALDKITVLNMDKLLNLSFGDMLLSNKIKKKTEIGKLSSEVIQQVFYPNDFLSTINSNPKCTIYDPEIANILDSVDYPINLDKKDYYGNSPLYYAINAQNYLFAKKLIENNARILNIKNNDKQNPFIYILEKLSSICEYFGKDNNIILQFNEYYSLGLKEEVMKLANHGNIMQNIDKIVLLYLFLLNSSFFNEMYKKDYELLNLLKQIYDDDTFDLFDGDSNYQSNFNYIFLNPILNRHRESINSTSLEVQDRDFEFDVVINLEKELKEKISKKEKEKEKLEAKVNNYTSIQSLLQPTNVSYATNIQDNITNIQTDIATLTTDIAQLESQLNKATTDIPMTINTEYNKINLGKNNIFQQIFEISKSYNENKYKDFTFRPLLKALHAISEDKSSFNNTYFFHHLISKVICQFVKYAKDVMNNKLITRTDLDKIKLRLDRIINIMKKSMYKYIHHKNNNVRNIDNNKQLNDQFMRMCFTIDIAVGNTFYKVLKRLLMTFLKNRYPVSNEDADKYLIFIRQKVGKILSKVDLYIQPNININNYEPSELTKKMVLLNTGYKSSTNEYSSSDENDFFDFIVSSIQNNGFETIDDKEPLIKYLRKEFLPYFINYYRICISKLVNVTNSYENFIINQYHNLNMFDLLLDNLIKGINSKNCDINTC